MKPPKLDRVAARNTPMNRPILPVLAQHLERALAENTAAREAKAEKKPRRRRS